MNTVIADFEKRVVEIELYFVHLENIEKHNTKIYFPNKSRRNIVEYDPELIKVFKASIFLLLYNLAESSVKQSLSALYDDISAKQLKYNEVIDEVKKVWIEEQHLNFKNKGTQFIFEAINAISGEIINIRFDEKKISGNIDGRKIKEFSQKHGFSNSTHYKANNGVKMLQVKDQRNRLAHGNISFAECGRNYSINELNLTKKEVMIHLRGILKNIKKHLDESHYKI